MTTTLEAPAKGRKASEAVFQPFYINYGDLNLNRKELERQIISLRRLRSLWNEIVSEFPIKSYEDLVEVQKNPVERFCSLVRNPAKKQGFFKKLIEETIEDSIKLPPRFNEIQTIASWHQYALTLFSMVDDEIILNEIYYRRLVNRSVWFAITPKQKKRFELASKMILLFNEVDEVLMSEFEEAHLPIKRFNHALNHKVHIGPLPIQLRYNFDGERKTIRVNEEWVVFGSKAQYDGLATGSSDDTFRLCVDKEGIPIVLKENEKAPQGTKLLRGIFVLNQGYLK